MSEVYFCHFLLDGKIEKITQIIDIYFDVTNLQIGLPSKLSLKVHKRDGYKFLWRIDPIELNYDDLGVESEIILRKRNVGGKEVAEIKITFTDHSFLELYFERLVYALLEDFETLSGKKVLTHPNNTPKFSSLVEYNNYRLEREMRQEKQLDDAFPDNKINKLSQPSVINHLEESEETENNSIRNNSKTPINTQESYQKITNEELRNNTANELVECELIYDVDKMKELSGYSSYNFKVMREIIWEVPKRYKEYKSSGRGKWGPRFITVNSLHTVTISRYLKALYRLGVRTIDGAPIPYSPKKND